jgi:ligand-binding sensor domain-containing protein
MNVWNNQLVIFSKNNDHFYTFSHGVFEKRNMNLSIDYIQNTSVIQNDAWICSTNGVTKYNLTNNTNQIYFKDQNVSYVYKDRHQNYWISTLNKGIIYVEDFTSTQIELDRKPIELSSGRNHLFIGSDKNLVYQLNYQNLKIENIFETENNHSVNQIFADDINRKLFFTSYKFQVLDEQKKTFYHYFFSYKRHQKA